MKIDRVFSKRDIERFKKNGFLSDYMFKADYTDKDELMYYMRVNFCMHLTDFELAPIKTHSNYDIKWLQMYDVYMNLPFSELEQISLDMKLKGVDFSVFN